MDTVTVAKTWIDFAFHAFDKAWPFLLPVIAGLLGWAAPSPVKRWRKPKIKEDGE